MPSTVFFSWQADTSTREGRNFIERALDRAAGRIGDDTTIEEAIRGLAVDRDTKDVPGSPPIVETIFSKIDKAAIVVPDLTFVGARVDGRPTPNPNVLIEYGWALKSLGHRRIVPVMNTAFGKPTAESMPFNLRHLRNPITYHCPDDADDEMRKRARDGLANELERALRAVLASEEFTAGLPEPSAPRQFSPRRSEDGLGRFRARGRPLGVNDGRRSFEVHLAEGPVVWFRLMPNIDPGCTWTVAEIRKIATAPVLLRLDDRVGDLWWVRSDDGFGVYTSDTADHPETACSVVFVFRTGEVWAADSLRLTQMVHQGQRFIPNIEELLANMLISYGKFLLTLGISPPYKWRAGMEDLKDRIPYFTPYSNAWFSKERHRCLKDCIIMDGQYSPGDDPKSSLGSFFIEMFDACGEEWPSFKDIDT